METDNTSPTDSAAGNPSQGDASQGMQGAQGEQGQQSNGPISPFNPSNTLLTDVDQTGEQGQQNQIEGAPENYENFVIAEGYDVDPSLTEEFRTVAKELGLSQERAQKLFSSITPAFDGYYHHRMQENVTTWGENCSKDKEIGGNNFNANLTVARTALQQFGDPELMEILSVTGLGSHPAVVRAFYRAGLAISPDKGVQSSGAPATKRKLYPNSNLV